jgi:excisionase family DNA binding protein
MSDTLIGYEQLSKQLGIKLGTLYSWVSRNQIPHIRISGKLVRFNPVAIDRWLADRVVLEDNSSVAGVRPGNPECKEEDSNAATTLRATR